ncbi:MAG: YARHG domain-containing protein [Mesorhizobium sp.]|nr:YARHG domain-containing protein [Mesorhizobium sp.]
MRLVLGLLALLAAGSAAQAACFEDLGRTGCTDRETFPVRDLRRLSCGNLWLVRNTIYDENGLCFRTDRALEVFDNADCYVKNPGNVRLNSYERGNVNRIVQVEREKGCR